MPCCSGCYTARTWHRLLRGGGSWEGRWQETVMGSGRNIFSLVPSPSPSASLGLPGPASLTPQGTNQGPCIPFVPSAPGGRAGKDSGR